MLDVNVGLPTIDQEAAMKAAVAAAEQSSDLPLSIDSDSRSVLESGLCAVTGIPLINSFTARDDSLYPGLALAKLHGAAAAVLPIDANGLPEKAEERIDVIRNILSAADSLGFPRNALIVDGLTLAAGADMNATAATLAVLAFLRDEGITSMLGVSNISHGMPARALLNRTFLAMAVSSGLDSAIMNPLDPWMMETLAASELLSGRDPRGSRFLTGAPGFLSSRQSREPAADTSRPPEKTEAAFLPEGPYRDLGTAIIEGDSNRAGSLAGRILDRGASLFQW